jgi:diacylglycerol kinase family enzyme
MEVVATAVNKKVKIGIVPLGTGNLFAQNINISLDLKEAFHTALFGVETKIDVGKANGTYFAIMAGMGLDAAMLKDANRETKNNLGALAYVLSACKNIFNPSNSYELKIDHKQPFTVKAKSIIVGNMAEISAGIKVVPNAHPQTGTLKIGVLKTHSIVSWIELLFTAVKSSVKDSNYYTLLEGSHIEIKSLRGKRMYECDGNLFPATEKMEIDIYPHSLKIVAPSRQI